MNATNASHAATETPASSQSKSRILVVEDHPLVRDGLIRLLERQPDLVCCGQMDCAAGTPAAVRELKPDLVLLDLTLKDGDGLELLDKLVQEFRELRVLVLSQHDEDTHAELALRNGAFGYVMKQEATQEVIAAIRKVLAGDIHLSHRMAARLLRKLSHTKLAAAPRDDSLTDREREVLHLLGGGLSTREIADELKLSVKTIETYREHLKSKLGLESGPQLTQYAERRVQGQSSPPPA